MKTGKFFFERSLCPLRLYGKILFLIWFCVSCSSPRVSDRTQSDPLLARANYPWRWWTPANTNGAPSWEIFPQEAKPGEVILSKRNELGLLSNFAATPFTFRARRYASLEGFWQMMKYPEGDDDPRAKFSGVKWPNTREEVAQMTGFEANRAGKAAEANMKTMGIEWVTFEGKRMKYRANERGDFYKLIVIATREKVRQNPDVKKVLLATGDLVLKPDHRQDPNAPPAWRYFDILMRIRSDLKKERGLARGLRGGVATGRLSGENKACR